MADALTIIVHACIKEASEKARLSLLPKVTYVWTARFQQTEYSMTILLWKLRKLRAGLSPPVFMLLDCCEIVR